jgi:hypothetical protein
VAHRRVGPSTHLVEGGEALLDDEPGLTDDAIPEVMVFFFSGRRRVRLAFRPVVSGQSRPGLDHDDR